MKKDSVRFPNKLLIGSVFFFLVGIGLLLVTTGVLPRYEDLWPIPMTLLGLLFLYLVSVKDAKFGYMVPGIVLTMSGILLTLQTVFFPHILLEQFWPLFMTFAGVSLILYGIKFSGNTRAVIMVPATFIIILSVVFLPFSMGLIQQSFRAVVAVWWPVMFILLSGGLLLEFMRKKKG